MVQKIKNLCHFVVAVFSVLYFRHPAKDLTVIGVTGTDGKTTTVNLIYEILRRAGKKTAMVSTVAARLGAKKIDTGFHVTTPSSFSLQKLLRRIKEGGYQYVVLEATSHGLDQYRLFGCNFKIGVLTNVTHEHLDYHGSWENYAMTKAKLFKNVDFAILNKDDDSFDFVKKVVNPKAKIITYGIKKKADLMPDSCPCQSRLPGEYNRYNCLAANGVSLALEIKHKVVEEAISNFEGIIGRMEPIEKSQDFSVIVDFAHTPNALENLLETLKIRRGKLIAVFGCAGLRDHGKRPRMGKIAASLADFSVLTAEDPRTEDVNDIIGQMAVGSRAGGAEEFDVGDFKNGKVRKLKKHVFFKVPDRTEAIKFAIQKLARKNDIVVICGKGHERSMCFGETEYPWSDQKEAIKAIREWLNKKKK